MKVTQEDERIPGKGVLVALVGLVAVTVIGVLAAYFITDCTGAALVRAQRPPLYVEPLAGATSAAVPGQVPGRVPEEVNRIEQVLFADRAPGLEQRAHEHTLLRSYGWVNRDARLVRIPIDRAIELYLQRQQESQP